LTTLELCLLYANLILFISWCEISLDHVILRWWSFEL